VLLLDEPTVGLDAHAEQVVVQPLTRLTEGRTLITATHQPALTALATCSIHLHAHTRWRGQRDERRGSAIAR